MPATPAGRQLTDAHRVAQARIGALTVVELRTVWSLLDPNDLAGTFARWLNVVEPIVRRHRLASVALAVAYLSAFRSVELGRLDQTFSPVLAGDLNHKALRTSMLVTGPVAVRAKLANAVPIASAMAAAEASTSSAAMRHALDGGRETIVTTANTDPAAKGWARVTSGDACAFCAMLASRGYVFHSEAAAELHVHDSCRCSAVVRYHDNAELPSHSARFRQLWSESTVGTSGTDSLNAFRRALAGK